MLLEIMNLENYKIFKIENQEKYYTSSISTKIISTKIRRMLGTTQD